MTFGEAIIKLRSERRISQRQLAEGFERELHLRQSLGERKDDAQ